MGKKMYVSSVTYPLGNDDPDKRTDYCQVTVLNAVLQGRDLGKSITGSYLTGQGMKLRNAYNYARDHFHFGLPSSGALFVNSPDKSYIKTVLGNRHPGKEILLNLVVVTTADFTFWAERWLTDTYGYDRIAQRFLRPPAGVDADATVTYDQDSNGKINILCVNADDSVHPLSFYPKDFASQRMYLHTVYQAITNFPKEKNTTTRAATPGEVDTISNVIVITEFATEIKEVTTVTDTNIAGGVATVIKTVTTRILSRPKYFLYEVGAGDYPVIDAWVADTDMGGAASPYFPSMPLRINNANVISEGDWPKHDLVISGKKLFKKVGIDIEEINEKLLDNDQISEIDFAYLVFGVAVNSKTPECKQYLFRFVEYLRSLTVTSRAEFDAWVTRKTLVAMEMASNGVGGSNGDGTGSGGGGGGTMPPAGTGDNPNIGYDSPPRNSLHIWHPNHAEALTINFEYQWNWIETTVHAGKIRNHPNAKPGECETFADGGNIALRYAEDMVVDGSSLFIQRQIDADTYEQIEISGFVHLNHIYQGKFVFCTAWDAFNEPDEEGFICVLNQQILRAMPIKQVTQMSYDCVHMVLNCYKVVKKKWYQSGWFAVLLIVIAIVLLVVSWGQSAQFSASMIGTATGILAGVLGVSFLIAMIIMATVVVLAMMILMKLLTPVFIDLFGPTWGPVILAIMSMWVGAGMSGAGGFGGAAQSMVNLSASTIINGTIAAVNMYAKYMEGKIAGLDVEGQIQALEDEAKKRNEEIEKLTKEMLGTHTDVIDIQGLIKAADIKFESTESFFRRTLMLGSDVANVTRGQVEDFVELGLYLPTTS